MKILFAFMMSGALLSSAVSISSAECNVCHSNNPRMRQMHQALGYKDCFKCHGFGQVKKAPEERAEQMKTDPLCSGCHNK